MRWVNESEFRSAPSNEVGIRKNFSAEVKSQAGKVQFCISSTAAERMGDVIAVNGWKLDAYKSNPVVLWAHDRKQPPIARATKIWTAGNRLEFTPKEMYPFGAMIGDMVREGFLTGVSVGFRPIKHAWNSERQGYDFLESELLEYSVVPVPANPEALLVGSGKKAAAPTSRKSAKPNADAIVASIAKNDDVWLKLAKVILETMADPKR